MQLIESALKQGLAGTRVTDAHIWAGAEAACTDLQAPLGILDLPALSYNAGSLLRRAGGKPIRVASKSIRSREVLRAVLAHDGFEGILAFTLPEALWLAKDETFTDIVVAYPSADPDALRALAQDLDAISRITLMVDSSEQLDWMSSALESVAAPIRLAIDLDTSWRPGFGTHALGHIGVRRSPVRDGSDAVALALDINARRRAAAPLFTLVGLMGYEAQIAGLQDTPHSGNKVADTAKSRLLKQIQKSSMAELITRRGQVVAAVRNVVELEFVNGGGTGSLELTTKDPSVTELAAGSGLFGPTVFDGYSRFKPLPAVGFATTVVRRPASDIITVLGGGWIASGPAGSDRLPLPVYPAGLTMIGTEGAGEVQTPLRGATAAAAKIGSKVWFRHAKSGEVCEHVDALEVVDGGTHVESVATYRGEGKAFV